MPESKSNKIRYWKSCSALRRFIRKAVEILGEKDPEAVRMFTRSDWSARTMQRHMTRLFKPGQMSTVLEGRLNDAGFKIYWEVDRDGSLQAYIGGDQTSNHPEAYIILTMLLHEEGLLPERRMDEVSPMTDYWFKKNVETLELWAKKWMKENFHLLNRSVSVILAYAKQEFTL